MKNFLKNIIIKRICIVLMIVLMMSNFIMPNYVCASAGEKLVSGFFYLIAYIGDKCIEIMQDMMVGDSEIKNGETYEIKYSPGVIFSNNVLALDINFISPNTKTIDSVIYNKTGTVGKASSVEGLYNNYGQILLAQLTSKSDINSNEAMKKIGSLEILEGTEQTAGEISINVNSNTYTIKSYYEKKKVNRAVYTGHGKGVVTVYYYYVKLYDFEGALISNFTSDSMEQATAKNAVKSSLKNKVGQLITSQTVDDAELQKIKNLKYSITEENKPVKIGNSYVSITRKTIDKGKAEYSYAIMEPTVIESKSSTAMNLRSNIATWYVALRTIALVGLLSVLVYLGIRIILSSTSAQDKAKYKNILKDWLVAICILFALHYIMAFMLNITEKINEIIKSNVITQNLDGTTTDKLMSTARQNIGKDLDNAKDNAGYTVMYLALVILTGVFTFQYLKRVIFMAFLTMIAPMIALTYPLDKVKDGKAQAFSYWLREYIFNCLIQPVHLLIYTILITNSLDFAVNNMLYAIAAIAFMVPAEKFVKEMFGMKSSSPSGTLGAAAGGAFVMSMINKMKAKPPKDDASAGNTGSSGVRTASSGAGAAGTAGGTGGTGGTGGSSGGTGITSGSSTSGGTGGAGSGSGSSSGGIGGIGSSGSNSGGSGVVPGGSSSTSVASSGIKGSSTTGHKTIKGVNTIKSGFGKFSRGVGGATLGLAAGTVGLAAQVADGDLFDNPEKAFGQVAGAAAVGYAAGSNLTGQAISKAGSLKNWIDEKTLGTEEYNNRNFDRKFYQSDGYKMIEQDSAIQALCSSNGISVAEATQTFLNEGITDATKIRDALQNGISGEVYKGYEKVGVSSGKDIVTLQSNGIGADEMKKFAAVGETSVSRIIDVKSKYPGYSNEHLANMFNLAKHAPKNLTDFKSMMVGRTFNGRVLTDSDAAAIFKELVDFF